MILAIRVDGRQIFAGFTETSHGVIVAESPEAILDRLSLNN
jgi:hypothetical protein